MVAWRSQQSTCKQRYPMEAKSIEADGIFKVFTACPNDPQTLILDVRPHKEFKKKHINQSYCVRVSSNKQVLADYSQSSYSLPWSQHCWWGKPVIVYGSAGVSKDHDVVKYLTMEGRCASVNYYKAGYEAFEAKYPSLCTPSVKANSIKKYPSMILSGFLYLGDWADAQQHERLQEIGIKRIVTVHNHPDRLQVLPGVKHLKIELADVEGADISPHFNTVYEFIADAERLKQPVLVHCGAGVSRSACLVMMYLMRSRMWSAQKCRDYCIAARSLVCPNDGFWRVLCALEGPLGILERSDPEATMGFAGADAPAKLDKQAAGQPVAVKMVTAAELKKQQQQQEAAAAAAAQAAAAEERQRQAAAKAAAETQQKAGLKRGRSRSRSRSVSMISSSGSDSSSDSGSSSTSIGTSTSSSSSSDTDSSRSRSHSRDHDKQRRRSSSRERRHGGVRQQRYEGASKRRSRSRSLQRGNRDRKRSRSRGRDTTDLRHRRNFRSDSKGHTDIENGSRHGRPVEHSRRNRSHSRGRDRNQGVTDDRGKQEQLKSATVAAAAPAGAGAAAAVAATAAQGQSGWLVTLEVNKPDGLVGHLVLGPMNIHQRVVFGRAPSCNVVLEHMSISRQHAVLTVDLAGTVNVMDMGAAHGTKLNDTWIKAQQPRAMPVGSKLRFGASTRMYALLSVEKV